jgi:hypothetical protein
MSRSLETRANAELAHLKSRVRCPSLLESLISWWQRSGQAQHHSVLARRIKNEPCFISATAAETSAGLVDTIYPFGAIPGQQVAVRKDSQSPGLPLGFYIYLPPDYDPSNTYPLVIWLHGHGQKGNGTTELSRVISSGAGLFWKFAVDSNRVYLTGWSFRQPGNHHLCS